MTKAMFSDNILHDNDTKMNSKYNIIDLFAGIGGIRAGLH